MAREPRHPSSRMSRGAVRRVELAVTYNGVDATEDLAPGIETFSYTDPACGEADRVSLEIENRDGRWYYGYMPVLGDSLKAALTAYNWESEGDALNFDCGSFMVDSFSLRSSPRTVMLEGVSLPADSNFKYLERTETYENATLSEIGQIIAGRAGVSLVFECADLTIEKVEQNKQPDADFYNSLLVKYGKALKIYNNKLVVFDEGDYEARPAKWTLTEQDFSPEWTWETEMQGTYKGLKYQYTSTEKNLTFTVEVGDVSGTRVLSSNEAAENLTEATAIALAAINEANKSTVTMDIEIMARPGLIATDCVEITDMGQLSGKYYVEQVESSLDKGYRMALRLRKVQPRFTEASSVSQTVAEGQSDG